MTAKARTFIARDFQGGEKAVTIPTRTDEFAIADTLPAYMVVDWQPVAVVQKRSK
jgi:hypothetical protein